MKPTIGILCGMLLCLRAFGEGPGPESTADPFFGLRLGQSESVALSTLRDKHTNPTPHKNISRYEMIGFSRIYFVDLPSQFSLGGTNSVWLGGPTNAISSVSVWIKPGPECAKARAQDLFRRLYSQLSVCLGGPLACAKGQSGWVAVWVVGDRFFSLSKEWQSTFTGNSFLNVSARDLGTGGGEEQKKSLKREIIEAEPKPQPTVFFWKPTENPFANERPTSEETSD